MQLCIQGNTFQYVVWMHYRHQSYQVNQLNLCMPEYFVNINIALHSGLLLVISS